MVRSVEDIIKEQLGNLLLQLSITQSQLEAEKEKNRILEEEKSKWQEKAKTS